MTTIARLRRPLVLLAATTLLTALPARAQAPAPAPFDAVGESRKVIDDLGGGRFAAVEARYAPEMLQALPIGQLAERWAMVKQQLGELKSLGDPKAEVRDGVTVVTFPATYEAMTLNLLVMWNGSGKMVGLLAQPAS